MARRLAHHPNARACYEMKKNLLVAFAATLIVIGSTVSQAQTFTTCTSQCDGAAVQCLNSCPPISTATPDPHTACTSGCYQQNASCHQSCIGLPLLPPAPPPPPLPPTPLNPG
jgi:hypothetical protein